ncbi:MAG: 2Fe-2S iron-sulfur cluster-binding protein [Phycisphaerae bacterium]
MSLRGLHEVPEANKTLSVTFILQDPMSLTGKPDTRVTAKAAPGQSLLVVALEAGIEIEHSCGGVCACSTCHIWVNRGAALLSEPTEEESDRMDLAPMVNGRSRLSCQAIIATDATTGVLEIEVPAWNRNAIKEGHHD